MTAPWEDTPDDPPAAQAPGQLSAILGGLFAESRKGGRVATSTLTSGLILTVSTDGGDAIALSRKGGQSDMGEAKTVAAQAGWVSWHTEWVTRRTGVYLVLRQDGAAAGVPTTPSPPDPDPPDDQIRALLLHPGPWRDEALSLRGPGAERVVSNFRRSQLRDFLAWARGEWPDQVARRLLDLQLAAPRQQLRDALK